MKLFKLIIGVTILVAFIYLATISTLLVWQLIFSFIAFCSGVLIIMPTIAAMLKQYYDKKDAEFNKKNNLP